MSKIDHVCMYKMYRGNMYDVVYHSGRVCTFWESDLPATVKKYIQSAAVHKEVSSDGNVVFYYYKPITRT